MPESGDAPFHGCCPMWYARCGVGNAAGVGVTDDAIWLSVSRKDVTESEDISEHSCYVRAKDGIGLVGGGECWCWI